MHNLSVIKRGKVYESYHIESAVDIINRFNDNILLESIKERDQKRESE